MNPEQVKQYLEFYRDLGVKELYRSSNQQARAAASAACSRRGTRQSYRAAASGSSE